MNPQVGTARLFEEKRFEWSLKKESSVKKAEIVTKDNSFEATLYLFNEHSPGKRINL